MKRTIFFKPNLVYCDIVEIDGQKICYLIDANTILEQHIIKVEIVGTRYYCYLIGSISQTLKVDTVGIFL